MTKKCFISEISHLRLRSCFEFDKLWWCLENDMWLDFILLWKSFKCHWRAYEEINWPWRELWQPFFLKTVACLYTKLEQAAKDYAQHFDRVKTSTQSHRSAVGSFSIVYSLLLLIVYTGKIVFTHENNRETHKTWRILTRIFNQVHSTTNRILNRSPLPPVS